MDTRRVVSMIKGGIEDYKLLSYFLYSIKGEENPRIVKEIKGKFSL